MGSLEMTCHHECGGARSSLDVSNDGEDENLCFSKAEEGPRSSQSYTAADSSNQGSDSDSEIDQISHSRTASSVLATDCVVDIDNGVDEVRISVGTMERECRICMLSLDSGSGIAIELGCSCKDGLEAAHQHCAETWFRSKGNNICEICNSIAQNVVVPNSIISRQQISQVNTVSTNAISVPVYEANTVSTYAAPMLVSQVNTSSTNAYSVPRSNVNSLMTNAVSLPVIVNVPSTSNMPRPNVSSLSTNVVSVPVSSTSSTSHGRECSMCECIVIIIFVLFLLFPIPWIFGWRRT